MLCQYKSPVAMIAAVSVILVMFFFISASFT